MRFALLLLLLLAPLAAHAQQTDTQIWFQSNVSGQITDDVRLTGESIGRFSDRAEGFSHSELGLLATVTVKKGVEIAFGYRHVADWSQGRTLPNEERLRQMVTVAIGSGFAARLRVEERFNSTGPQVGMRVRPQLRYNRPIGGGWGVFATQEHYLNLNDTRWGQRSGHERMRNALGLTIPLAKGLTGDVGYLNQYRFGRRGARDQMDHAATFALSLTL